MTKKTNNTNKPVDKHADFLRVATPRLNKALDMIDLLKNQAGVAYAPTKAEVASMLKALHTKVDELGNCYAGDSSVDSGFSFPK